MWGGIVSKLHALMEDEGAMIMYESSLRRVIEDHLQYIINDNATEIEEIPSDIAHKHHGDFYGVLRAMGVDASMYWIIMRVNGYTSPMQYTDDRTTVLVPSSAMINNIITTHRVNQKIGQRSNN